MSPSLIHCKAADYHADKTAVSASALKLFDRAPSLFRDWQEGRFSSDPTPAMKRGSLIHTMTLEPENFAASYVVVPHDAPRKPSSTQREAKKPSPDTVAAIEWWDAFAANANGKEILTPFEYSEAEAIAEKCFANELMGKILRAKGEVEAVLVWTDEETGLPCKARMDKVLNGFIFDLKSASDASLDGFRRAAVNQGYHIQVAHYLAGYAAVFSDRQEPMFLFGAVETIEPFLTHCFRSAPDFIAHGQSERRRLMRNIAEAKATGRFPGLCPDVSGVSDLTLPAWAKTS